jgi:hypothetical protein
MAEAWLREDLQPYVRVRGETFGCVCVQGCGHSHRRGASVEHTCISSVILNN